MSFLTQRLNIQYDYFNLDAAKAGAPLLCGKGWVGTKGQCRRAKKGEGGNFKTVTQNGKKRRVLTEQGKASARALADEVRKKRGMMTQTQAKTQAKTSQAKQQSKDRIAKNREMGKANLPKDVKPTPTQAVSSSKSSAIVPRSQSGSLATRGASQQQFKALAQQAGSMLMNRAKQDLEATRKEIQENTPAVKQAARKLANQAAYKAGQGFGAAVKAVNQRKKNKKK